jgi:hypothetical protein
MAISIPNPGSLINTRLLGEPLNWAIVGVVATIWLFAFHIIMQAFGNMQSTVQGAIGAAPGQVAAPATAVSVFSAPGIMGTGSVALPGLFDGGAATVWTDGYEARYPSDGAIFND